MDDFLSNDTVNSSASEAFICGPSEVLFLSLIDICTFLLGQPLIIKLLWITFTSSKTPDILDGNLAIFHNFQYLVSIVHSIVLSVQPEYQTKILRFLFVYAQIGGPTNLAFICMQRYVAVIHPTSYSQLKKYRYREVCAVIVWLLSVPIAFASLFAGETVSSLTQKMVDIFPFCVMTFMTAMVVRCSISIARMLKKSSPGKNKLHPAKSRAFKVIRATSAIALFFYLPVTFLERFRDVGRYAYICIVTPVCIFLLSAASVVHPVFHLSTRGKLFTCSKWEKKTK